MPCYKKLLEGPDKQASHPILFDSHEIPDEINNEVRVMLTKVVTKRDFEFDGSMNLIPVGIISKPKGRIFH